MSQVVNATVREAASLRTSELRRVIKVMLGRWVVVGGLIIITVYAVRGRI